LSGKVVSRVNGKYRGLFDAFHTVVYNNIEYKYKQNSRPTQLFVVVNLFNKYLVYTFILYGGLCSCVPEWPTALTWIVRISFRLFRRIL
jgi:hypothetical protein